MINQQLTADKPPTDPERAAKLARAAHVAPLLRATGALLRKMTDADPDKLPLSEVEAVHSTAEALRWLDPENLLGWRVLANDVSTYTPHPTLLAMANHLDAMATGSPAPECPPEGDVPTAEKPKQYGGVGPAETVRAYLRELRVTKTADQIALATGLTMAETMDGLIGTDIFREETCPQRFGIADSKQALLVDMQRAWGTEVASEIAAWKARAARLGLDWGALCMERSHPPASIVDAADVSATPRPARVGILGQIEHVGMVRRIDLLGKPGIEVRDAGSGTTHVYPARSIHGIQWLTPAEVAARSENKAAALLGIKQRGLRAMLCEVLAALTENAGFDKPLAGLSSSDLCASFVGAAEAAFTATLADAVEDGAVRFDGENQLYTLGDDIPF